MTFPSNIHWRALSPSLLLSCSFPSSGMVVRVVCTVASLFVVPVVAVDACLGNSLYSATHTHTYTQTKPRTHTCMQALKTRLQSGKYVKYVRWRKIDEHLHVVNIPDNILGFSTCKEESSAPPPLVAIYLLLAFHEAADRRSRLWCVYDMWVILLNVAPCEWNLLDSWFLCHLIPKHFGYVWNLLRNCDAFFTRENAWAT